ncbi:MAG: hypothetical protein IT458_09970 [Planctomycetes bacterium]|nr:hypothetical protein [Planctomycetota bacterium]
MLKLVLNPPAKQVRQFQWIAVVAFPVLALVLAWIRGLPLSNTLTWVFLGIAALILVAELAVAELWERTLGKWLFQLLTLITMPIGMVISFVLLGLIYYGMFTPVALWFRIIGRDPMHRRIDKAATSYWHARTRQRTPASYLRQY